MNKCLRCFLLLLIFSCSSVKYKNPHVLINTTYGDIEVEVYPDKAPKTVAAFLSYIDSGYYTSSSFYRLITNENVPSENNTGLIQGGIYKTNPNKLSTIAGIIHESTNKTGLSHTDGTISMARTTLGSASTEFFICIGNQIQFDSSASGVGDGQGFAAFGKVLNGMDIVSKIQNSPNNGESFKVAIKINTIKRM